MGRVSRGAALTVILALVAGVGGGWLGASVWPRPQAPISMHDVVHHELDLSPEQQQRLAVLERDFAVRRKAREAELKAANAELAAAIASHHEYSPEVAAAVERFHVAMGALQKETVQHVLAMRGLLTAKQAQTFDRRVTQALTTDAP